MVEYHFFAPLANAHGHFRSLNLDSSFRIERWTHAKIIKLWRQLAWMPKFEISLLAEDRQVVPFGYKVGHVVVGKVSRPNDNEVADWIRRRDELHKLEISVTKRLRLAGLFLCGQVEFAAVYWYTIQNGKPELDSGGMSLSPLRSFPATMNQNTIKATNDFVSATLLPLSPEYLQTALEHWEEAHRSTQSHMEFLSLMVALETLFNVGSQDIRYRVSRSVAVFLGKSAEDSDRIFESVKHAYDVRSKLVHTGKAKGLEKVWLWQLRHIVQQVILKMYELKVPKDELAARLTRLGFGQGSQVTANPSIERTLPSKSGRASHVKS
jgi:hypothetical protein